MLDWKYVGLVRMPSKVRGTLNQSRVTRRTIKVAFIMFVRISIFYEF